MGDLVAENAGAMGWMKRDCAVAGFVSGWKSLSLVINDRLFDILASDSAEELA